MFKNVKSLSVAWTILLICQFGFKDGAQHIVPVFIEFNDFARLLSAILGSSWYSSGLRYQISDTLSN